VLLLPRLVSPRGFVLLWCVLGVVLVGGTLGLWTRTGAALARTPQASGAPRVDGKGAADEQR
jgi:hypothetical protein